MLFLKFILRFGGPWIQFLTTYTIICCYDYCFVFTSVSFSCLHSGIFLSSELLGCLLCELPLEEICCLIFVHVII